MSVAVASMAGVAVMVAVVIGKGFAYGKTERLQDFFPAAVSLLRCLAF
jgi:hypothetical protein